MLVAIFPLMFAFVGAFVYALSANAKAQELGRGAYWVGLFWLVSALATRTLHL